MARDSYLQRVLGNDTVNRLRHTKVLMVGAGGIGCELIKDLMLAGYGEIHIVDLDTITLSNLNRQFLFRQKDIDESKALAMAAAVQNFNYHSTRLIPHHGNIMDTTQFSMKWWRQFSFVFNALDNLEARRYVNKMCLFLRAPLMELGTTGFDGQVQPILPYVLECFDCQAKVTPKTYPVCTIRLTPSQPVHNITWAKEFLFRQLYDESDEPDITGASENADEQALLEAGVGELASLKLRRTSPNFFSELVVAIFVTDIERLRRIDALWKTRTAPTPLKYDANAVLALLSNPAAEVILTDDTRQWLVTEDLYVLAKATEALAKRVELGETAIEFDKDDEDTLNFVAAAANLRSNVFSIPEKTKFVIKEIAGNIIPAIATTNAIIAGLLCLGGTRYFLSGQPKFERMAPQSLTVFISIKPNKYLTGATVVGPNPKCALCARMARGVLRLTTGDAEKTLAWFLSEVAKYGYDADAVLVSIGSKLLYDPDFDDRVSDPLLDLPGFGLGAVLLVQDEDDQWENLELYLELDAKSTEFPELKLSPKATELSEVPANEMLDEVDVSHTGDTIIVDEDEDEIVLVEEFELPPTKKRKIDSTS